jgi:hypothetical protein
MSSHCGKCFGEGHKEESCNNKPFPSFDKVATIRQLIQKEMYYLGNSGWLCYVGTRDNKFWAHKDEPEKLMTQSDAMVIQRKIDGF